MERKAHLQAAYQEELEYSSKVTRLEWIFLHADKELDEESLSGWEILDLGCGSAFSSQEDFGLGNDYEAWFPRVCALHGASRVIGVDIFDQDPNDKDLYTHITADLIPLLEGDKLINLFKGSKFDLIHTNAAIIASFPGYTYARTSGLSTSEHLLGCYPEWFTSQTERLLDNLKRQSVRLLKPNGMLAINREVYKLNAHLSLEKLKL